jgi:FlaA1/EpsC-like NDP-sugar epimerase
VLVDQAESPLYFVHLDLCKTHPQLNVVPVIADVTDAERMKQVFAEHLPECVFHAAAYKHVPMMEANVSEAVRNNVLGTFRVAGAAVEHGAGKFVLISTDKAVHPSSVMGATKRIAERVVLGWPTFQRSRTDFRAVRFGNVLGSDGSVVPLFNKQIAAGGPVTITHPEVTRYFMTIPEAVQLVLQAASLPEAARRISMLEMGEPVRILELAENLIRLSGMEPYTEMPIVFTGLRPGEKLYEELMSAVETTVPTAIEKVRVVQTDEADAAAIQGGLADLVAALTAGGSGDGVLSAIRNLVPECVAPLRNRVSVTGVREPRRELAKSA